MTTTIKLPTNAPTDASIIEMIGTGVIRDVVLDGNRDARGWPGGWDWQQSFNVYCHDGTFDIDRVRLINTPSDGIHFGKNVTATLNDIEASACFRGAVTMVGGNSTITIDNLQGEWLHMEWDTYGDGSSKAINLTLTNSVLPRGVELESWGTLDISDCDLGSRFWLYGEGGAAATFTNCAIGLGGADDAIEAGFEYATNTIQFPRDVTFTNCTFTGSRLNLGPEVYSAPGVLLGAFTDQHITFDNCHFNGNGGPAIYNYGDEIDRGNVMEFTNGCTYSGFDSAYEIRPGFIVDVIGTMTAV